MIKNSKYELTNREKENLTILWNSDDPLVASDIVKYNEELTINTVQAILKKLLNKGFIQVDQIVYSGTVLCRSYAPTMNHSTFYVKKFIDFFKKDTDPELNPGLFVATLLEEEKDSDKLLDEINSLEKMLEQKKRHIQSMKNKE